MHDDFLLQLLGHLQIKQYVCHVKVSTHDYIVHICTDIILYEHTIMYIVFPEVLQKHILYECIIQVLHR